MIIDPSSFSSRNVELESGGDEVSSSQLSNLLKQTTSTQESNRKAATSLDDLVSIWRELFFAFWRELKKRVAWVPNSQKMTSHPLWSNATHETSDSNVKLT